MASNEPEDLKFEQALQQATRRFVDLRRPDADADDHRAHRDWLAADPLNAEAFAEIESLWRDLGPAAQRLARERREHDAAVMPAPILAKRPVMAAAAAGLMLLCIAATVWWEWRLITHASAGRVVEDSALQSAAPADR
jgi:ferric-dicitrate binding protein FerR (iron transport regulator)